MRPGAWRSRRWREARRVPRSGRVSAGSGWTAWSDGRHESLARSVRGDPDPADSDDGPFVRGKFPIRRRDRFPTLPRPAIRPLVPEPAPHESPASLTPDRLATPAVPPPSTSPLFGEAMLMLVADRPGPIEHAESFHKRTAGAETNVAIGLSRLGLKVGWASRLGTDSMGRYLIDAMQAEGIDCSHVVCDASQRTGFQFKGRVDRRQRPAGRIPPQGLGREPDGARPTSTRPGCARRATCTPRASSRRISDTSLRAAVARHGRDARGRPHASPSTPTCARRSGRRPRPCARPINDLASRADWVLPGIEEGLLLTGESTPEGIARFYRAARREAGGGQAGRRGRLLRRRRGGRHRPRAGLSGRAGDRHRRRRRRLRGRRGERAARRARRARRGAARQLDRRPRRAGAGRHRRPADAGATRGGASAPTCIDGRAQEGAGVPRTARRPARAPAGGARRHRRRPAHRRRRPMPSDAALAAGAGPDRLELPDRPRAARRARRGWRWSPACRSASTTTRWPRCTRAASCCATRPACSTRPWPTPSSRC